MSTRTDVSIVVSNFNSSSLLNGALQSVLDTAEDVSFDLVVVDDASTDGGLSLVDEAFKRDPRISFVQMERNVGISALNCVYSHPGRYIMTLDADARLQPGALRAMVEFLDTHPKAGIVTGNLRNADGSTQNYYRLLIAPKLLFFTTLVGRFVDKYFLGLRVFNAYRYVHFDVDSNPEIEQPPIACLMMRREAIEEKIMDPSMYLLSIDVDLCKRAYDKGYKIYLVSKARVTHLKSVSFAKRESAWRRREYYGGLNLYFRKHYPLHMAWIWPMLWVDRGLRALMTRALDREILR